MTIPDEAQAALDEVQRLNAALHLARRRYFDALQDHDRTAQVAFRLYQNHVASQGDWPADTPVTWEDWWDLTIESERDAWLALAADIIAFTTKDPAIDEAHLARQAEFSAETFGPGDRTYGVIDHIRKELQEVADAYEAREDTLSEWVDIVILALDGAWRSGHTPAEIITAVKAKQARNEERTWPDWRTADSTKAIEHDRTEET